MDKHTFTLDYKTIEILIMIARIKNGDENISAAIRWVVRDWLDKQEQAS